MTATADFTCCLSGVELACPSGAHCRALQGVRGGR